MILVGLPPLRKIAKAAGGGVDSAFEGADHHLVIIARVDHGDIRLGDQRVPILRGDVVADACGWVYVGLAHGHNLGLQAHFHAAKGHGSGGAFLPDKAGKTGPGADMGQHSQHAFARACDRAIHAFTGEQDGAHYALRLCEGTQGCLPQGGVILTGKMVKGGNSQHGGDITKQAGLGKRRVIG